MKLSLSGEKKQALYCERGVENGMRGLQGLEGIFPPISRKVTSKLN